MLDLVRLERSGTLPLDFRTQKSALVVPGFMGWDRATQGTCKKITNSNLRKAGSSAARGTRVPGFWLFGFLAQVLIRWMEEFGMPDYRLQTF